jgi:hypothetical protein
MLFLPLAKNAWDNVRHLRVASQPPSRHWRDRVRVEETAPEKRASILTRVIKSVANSLHSKPRPNQSVFANTWNDTTNQTTTISAPPKLPDIDSVIVSTDY